MKDAKLGIDFGGIIVPAAAAEDPSFFGQDCEDNGVTPRCGTIESLQKLVQAFEGKVWIISRAAPDVAQCTRLWLARHDFWRQTGMDSRNLVFCWDRQDKLTVCRALGITHYLDDRLAVLEALQGQVRHLYLMPDEIEERASSQVVHVDSWEDAMKAILGTLH